MFLDKSFFFLFVIFFLFILTFCQTIFHFFSFAFLHIG